MHVPALVFFANVSFVESIRINTVKALVNGCGVNGAQYTQGMFYTQQIFSLS